MKKKFSGTEIVGKLRQADIFIGQGKTILLPINKSLEFGSI
jgi:hypothetical protein